MWFFAGLVEDSESFGLFGSEQEGGIGHIEWLEDGGVEVVFEGFFGEDFDDAAGDIESAAVLPAGAGFEAQREFGERVDMFCEGAAVGDSGCRCETGGVCEDFADERCADWSAVGEFKVLKGGDVFRDGIFDAAAALSDELHESGGGDGFGEGGDAEDGAFLHGRLGVDISESGEREGFAMGMLFAADPSRHAAIFDQLLQWLCVVCLLSDEWGAGEDRKEREEQPDWKSSGLHDRNFCEGCVGACVLGGAFFVGVGLLLEFAAERFQFGFESGVVFGVGIRCQSGFGG